MKWMECISASALYKSNASNAADKSENWLVIREFPFKFSSQIQRTQLAKNWHFSYNSNPVFRHLCQKNQLFLKSFNFLLKKNFHQFWFLVPTRFENVSMCPCNSFRSLFPFVQTVLLHWMGKFLLSKLTLNSLSVSACYLGVSIDKCYISIKWLEKNNCHLLGEVKCLRFQCKQTYESKTQLLKSS